MAYSGWYITEAVDLKTVTSLQDILNLSAGLYELLYFDLDV